MGQRHIATLQELLKRYLFSQSSKAKVSLFSILFDVVYGKNTSPKIQYQMH